VRVTASDGSNQTVSDDFNITVNTLTSKGMLSSLYSELTDYVQDPAQAALGYVNPSIASLFGDYQSGSQLLTFANTKALLQRGNILALTDGNASTVGTPPQLSLALANVPVLGATLQTQIEMALTAGTDRFKTTAPTGGESQVRVILNVEMFNDANGQLVIRALTQDATISIVNSDGNNAFGVPLPFGSTDVIASSSTVNGQSLLNFNVFGLLAKLDGGLGAGVGLLLAAGNYTLSIIKTEQGVNSLPLTDPAGLPINGIVVGVPITDTSANIAPALSFGDDLEQIHLQLVPGQTFELGQFLGSGGGIDSASALHPRPAINGRGRDDQVKKFRCLGWCRRNKRQIARMICADG
jgi:hypothetical protein